MLLAAALFAVLRVLSGPVLDSDIVSLLPKDERDRVLESAAAQMRQSFERRLVILAGGESEEAALALARQMGEALQNAEGLTPDTSAHVAGEQGMAFYLERPHGLMSASMRAVLAAGDAQAIEAAILRRYMNPSSFVSSALVSRDPLLLLPGFLEEALPPPPGLRLSRGTPFYASGGRFYVPLFYEVAGSPFALGTQAQVSEALGQAEDIAAAAGHGASLWSAGVVRHAARGSDMARGEISTVGLGALLGVVLLILAAFRSALPLAASLLSIGAGVLAGFSASLAVFGNVHLLTLVFGGSLIGISVDYLFHYFCERLRPDRQVPARAALSHVFPGITLGLVTTLIGFAGLWLAPFPGLWQMALFSSAGLAASYLTVCLWFPALTKRARPMPAASLVVAGRLLGAWQRLPRTALLTALALLAILAAAGIARLAPQDDVRLFQSLDAGLLDEQGRIETVLGTAPDSRFFLIEGRTEEEMLAREEGLRAWLEDAGLASLPSLSRFVPSKARQQADRALLSAYLSNDGAMASLAAALGLDPQALEAYRQELAQAPLMTLAAWAQSPVSAPYRHLYLGKTPRGVIAALPLQAVDDSAALEGAERLAGVHLIDTAAAYSRLFAEYRQKAVLLALLSYACVAGLLLWRYGPRGAAAVMAAPCAAALASLGYIGLSGEVFSLFNVMALLLVLGISVDYGIFFREAGQQAAPTLLAVLLSALTTLLAFGLLAFSSTAAIHAFGITVFAGITIALLVSPIAGPGHLGGNRNEQR